MNSVAKPGSTPGSILARFQMLSPLVQWPMASSMDLYLRCFCLTETMTFT